MFHPASAVAWYPLDFESHCVQLTNALPVILHKEPWIGHAVPFAVLKILNDYLLLGC